MKIMPSETVSIYDVTPGVRIRVESNAAGVPNSIDIEAGDNAEMTDGQLDVFFAVLEPLMRAWKKARKGEG